MKIKSVLGVVAAMALSICCAVTAYADNSYTIGKPVDVSTGQEVDDLKAGQKVMIPVDFTSTNSYIKAYQAVFDYDSSIIKIGIAKTGFTKADLVALKFKGALVAVEGDTNTIAALDCMGEYDDVFENFTTSGVKTTVNKYAEGKALIQWYAAHTNASHEGIEAYLFVEVLADVPSDKLNYTLFEPNLGKGESSVNDFAVLDKATAEKANACFAAFNVVVDPADLGGWLQKLTVNVGKKATVELKEYYEEGSTYVFPVRVTANNTSAGSASIDVTATVTDDEAGTGTSKEVKYERTGITFGTPTTYANPTLTVAK